VSTPLRRFIRRPPLSGPVERRPGLDRLCWRHPAETWPASIRARRLARSPIVVRSLGRAHSTTIQFDEASHVGGLTHYAARFVKLIEQAIDATAK
jgi:hypothetical protein